MISKYLVGVPSEDHAKVKEEYEHAFRFRKRLNEVLEKDIETEIKAMLLNEEFDSNEQLKRLSNIRMLKKVQKMLN